jgi:tetratricopeptide (TPR) repeat protein
MSTGSWIFIGILATLGGLIVRFWVPQALRAKIRRTGGVVGSDEPERPAVASEILPPAPSKALQQKDVHDELLRDVVKLVNLSRARDAQSLSNLDDADEKLAEALLLRPDGFEATRLLAEVAIARAQLVDPLARVAAHEEAARRFDAALDLRKGIADLYIGLGWSWLGVMQHDPIRADAPVAALGAFVAGHETSRGNLWLLKGWGTAVDIMVRRSHPQAEQALAQYEAALGRLTGPASIAVEWFSTIRAGGEPTWLPVPPLRDV